MKKCLFILAAVLLMLCMTSFAEETADEVLVTVNGTEIMKSTVDNYHARYIAYYFSMGYDASDEDLRQYLKAKALNDCLEEELIRQNAERAGVCFSQQELDALTEEQKALWHEITAEYATYYFGLKSDMTEEEKDVAMEQASAYLLEQYGFTEGIYVRQAVNSRLRQLLTEAYSAGITVGDEEVRACFDTRETGKDTAYTEAAREELRREMILEAAEEAVRRQLSDWLKEANLQWSEGVAEYVYISGAEQ